MPLTIKPASGSGSMTLISVAGTTTNDTLTLPAKTGNVITSADSGTVTQAMLGTGVAGNGPAFSAYRNGTQTLSSATWTKIQINTEDFDTANCFDPTTNYRFTPNVAGYYQMNWFAAIAGTSGTYMIASLYKNGSEYAVSNSTSAASSEYKASGTTIVYMNGSTDYLELYGIGTVTSGSVSVYGGSRSQTNISGALIRAA